MSAALIRVLVGEVRPGDEVRPYRAHPPFQVAEVRPNAHSAGWDVVTGDGRTLHYSCSASLLRTDDRCPGQDVLDLGEERP